MNNAAVIDAGTVSCTEVSADDLSLDNQLYIRIYEDFLTGRLKVPIMPDIATRIRRAVSGEDADATSVTKIIQTDPPLSAYLIRVGNSPLYSTGRPVQELKSVVSRLGLMVIRDLVMSFTLKNLYASKNAMLKRRMTDAWMHSCAVSAFCHVIAKETRAANVDRALLAGLLHDIGDVVILSRAEDYPELIKDTPKLDQTLATLRGQIGAMVLNHWQMEDDFVQAAAGAEDWERNGGAGVDLCDIVVVAQILLNQTQNDARPLPAPESIPAFVKLATGRDLADFSSRITEGARVELLEVQKLLQG